MSTAAPDTEPTADGADDADAVGPVSPWSWWLVPPGAVGLVVFLVLVGVGVLSGAMAIGGEKVVVEDGALAWSPVTPSALPQDLAVAIGTDQVTVTELETTATVLAALSGSADRPDPRELALAVAVGRVLEAEAARRDIFVTEQQVESRLDAVVEAVYDGDRDALLERLEADGVSDADLEQEVRQQLQAGALLDAVAEDVEAPGSEQLSAYFEAHREELTAVEYRAITNAVMKTEEGAGKVVARYESGEGMGDLARRFSQDDSTRLDKGDLGLVSADMLEPAYADVAFEAVPQTVFGPVLTPGGWNVGEVREVVAPGEATLEQAMPRVIAGYAADTTREAQLELVDELLSAVEVQYGDDYRPADTDAPDLSLVAPAAPVVADPGAGPSPSPSVSPSPAPGTDPETGTGAGPLLPEAS